MTYNPQPLENLIEHFARLPGIGYKGATRLAYQILAMSKADAESFAKSILDVHEKIHRCKTCQNFTDADFCPVCNNEKRDKSIICVVEKPRDVNAFEKTREYNGTYHVLHGLISPMDGITADRLCVKELMVRLAGDEVKEVIMATSPTAEGETTALYLAKLIKPLGINVSRLAYG
ncbi:MAG: recombination mediator RecR, partial [Oscillospiraceae bacterium]